MHLIALCMHSYYLGQIIAKKRSAELPIILTGFSTSVQKDDSIRAAGIDLRTRFRHGEAKIGAKISRAWQNVEFFGEMMEQNVQQIL